MVLHDLQGRVLSLVWDLQSGKAHERTADQLKDELETLQQKLELVLAADPGVVDQYERRKDEVCSIMMFGCSGSEVISRASTDQVINQENRRP